MPKLKLYLPLIIGVATAIGIYIGGKLNFSDHSDRIFVSNSKKEKLNRLIDYIEYEYVEDVNTDSIVDVTVNEILDNLDPHSIYIPKNSFKKTQESLKGNFVGIGINYYNFKDTITVVRSLKNGPSEKAGIIGGDRIITINGDSITSQNQSNEDVIKKIKGEINTRVKLGIYRKSSNQYLNIEVKRGLIPIKSIEASYMLNDSLGYIKLNRFAESSYKEFISALKSLKSNGIKTLILDLRDNPGGLITIANKIVDEFLEDDKLIMFTKNKSGDIKKSFATKKGVFENNHVYILINENSASASEIVAGALQDNDKGTIVGRRSFGKGLVQREMQFGDGSAIRLTVSKYYTPTGRSIQRNYDKGNDHYFEEYYDRYQNGELTNQSNIQLNDSLKFTTPKGKVVYGGGGIIPDIFVPLNKGMNNQTLEYIEKRGLTSQFVFEWIEKDRLTYSRFNETDFISNFVVNDKMVTQYEVFLEEKTQSDIVFVSYKDEVKQYIKANIAKQLFGINTYYKVLCQFDNMIEKILELEINETI